MMDSSQTSGLTTILCETVVLQQSQIRTFGECVFDER